MIEKLFESFLELGCAIESAKKSLWAEGTPPKEVIARIETYEEILKKQKKLAQDMCKHAQLGNWDEVTRHIKLINGLSLMIRDDAQDVLSTLRRTEVPQERVCLAS